MSEGTERRCRGHERCKRKRKHTYGSSLYESCPSSLLSSANVRFVVIMVLTRRVNRAFSSVLTIWLLTCFRRASRQPGSFSFWTGETRRTSPTHRFQIGSDHTIEERQQFCDDVRAGKKSLQVLRDASGERIGNLLVRLSL